MKTGGRKRTKLQREMHQDEWLHLTGMSQKDIGAKFGLSQGQVSKDLTAGFARRAAQREPTDPKVLLAKALARLDLVERDCWRAWDASTQPKVIHTKEAAVSQFPKSGENSLGCNTKGPRRAKTCLRVEQRDGNPAFLRGVQKCIESRCKWLGLYSDTAKDLLDKHGGEPIQIIEVREAPPRQPAPDSTAHAEKTPCSPMDDDVPKRL